MTAPAMQQAPSCPVCKGAMWDQKTGKYPWKPGTPIFKCRDKECASKGGVLWEPKGNGKPVEQQHHTDWHSGAVQEPKGVTGPSGDVIAVHYACFKRALELAVEAERAGIVGIDLNGVSALTAQLFIATTRK